MSVQFAQISKLSSEYQLTPGAVEVNEAFQLFADNLKVGLECVSSDPSAADITINIAGELLQKIGVPHEKIVIVNGMQDLSDCIAVFSSDPKRVADLQAVSGGRTVASLLQTNNYYKLNIPSGVVHRFPVDGNPDKLDKLSRNFSKLIMEASDTREGRGNLPVANVRADVGTLILEKKFEEAARLVLGDKKVLFYVSDSTSARNIEDWFCVATLPYAQLIECRQPGQLLDELSHNKDKMAVVVLDDVRLLQQIASKLDITCIYYTHNYERITPDSYIRIFSAGGSAHGIIPSPNDMTSYLAASILVYANEMRLSGDVIDMNYSRHVNGPESYCYYRSPPPVPRWLP